MSTRSGKRIHSSFHESPDKVDKELVVMSERKTKSTRLKENKQDYGENLLKSKKRNNYVSYPTDDENLVEADDMYDNDVKQTRITRRKPLKEPNIKNSQRESFETLSTAKKQVRITRKTKKLTENDVQIAEHYNSPDEQNSLLVQKVKSKKSKDLHVEEVTNVTEPVVVKKKSKKKKGKKSNSLISELTVSIEENLTGNLNMSTDSFHSAIESPIRNRSGKNNTKPKTSKNIDLNCDITDDRRTKTHDKGRNEIVKEFFEINNKNTTYDPDKSLSESTDSFVFHKGSGVNDDMKIKRVCSENLILDEQATDKETSDSAKTKKCAIINTAHEKENVASTPDNLKLREINRLLKNSKNHKNNTPLKKTDTTFEKEQDSTLQSPDNKRKSRTINTTFEKDTQQSHKSPDTSNSNISPIQHLEFRQDNLNLPDRLSAKRNSTFDKLTKPPKKINSTFEIENSVSSFNSSINKRQSTLINTTFEKETRNILETLELSGRRSNADQIIINTEHTNANSLNSVTHNTTFELKNSQGSNTNRISSINKSITKSHSASSFDKEPNINTTFEKDSNSSLISSDGSKCQDISHITITSDDSTNQDLNKTSNDVLSNEINDDYNPDTNKTSNDVSLKENTMNTTPYIIESSIDETILNTDETVKKELVTPLKREGTFTKDSSDILISNSAMVNLLNVTPNKRISLPSPGCTPFAVGNSSKGQFVLNVTRSLEKSRRSSLAEPVPRTTRVMFCSPVNEPAMVSHQKRKVIKSNLKGSKKSFLFQECDSPVRASPRKRSYTQNDADYFGAKRKRLTEDMQVSVDRLSRPRTSSAAAKLTESTTPSKKEPTPSKDRTNTKVSRTKLPNFAALHRKQFDKMESLDECQERKAKRARRLLTPTTAAKTKNLLKDSIAEVQKEETQKPSVKDVPKKPDSISNPPIGAVQKPGFTRFGFKLNLDVNPFSIPSKNTDVKADDDKPKGLVREATMPSMTGTTSFRRETAKQIVMREKTFTQKNNIKRNETRSIIKGVRTNRRFELQMKLRNIE